MAKRGRKKLTKRAPQAAVATMEAVADEEQTQEAPKKEVQKWYKFWSPHAGYQQTLERGGYAEGGVIIIPPIVAEFEAFGKNGSMFVTDDGTVAALIQKKIKGKKELVKAVLEVTDDPAFEKVGKKGFVSSAQ